MKEYVDNMLLKHINEHMKSIVASMEDKEEYKKNEVNVHKGICNFYKFNSIF